MTLNERTSLPLWIKIIIFIISFILFAVQIFILFTMFDLSLSLSYRGVKWIYLLTEGIGVSMVLYMLKQPISINYKLTWSILFLILPLPFTLLYLLNSLSKVAFKVKNKKNKLVLNNNINTELTMIKEEDYEASLIANVCIQDKSTAIYKNSKITFFNDCYQKHLDMLEELKKAEKFIYFEYFIVEDGYLMNTILPILEEKGKQGVEIKFLYDDIGSKRAMTKKLLKRLSNIKNCKIDNYEPIGLNVNFLINYRDHRKLTIIDGKVCYCGGDNLADEYIHKKVKYGYWRDNCLKIEGTAVNGFLSLFSSMWNLSTKEEIIIQENRDFYNEKGYLIPIGDGPLNESDVAYDLFMSLINSATKSLYISTPYFIIDESMINSICLKAKEGVDVRILLPHIPDKKSVFYMSRFNYEKILKSGGKIYEFTKGFNHAKNIIVDDKYAFVGTINMDYRSLFLHYECGALIIKNKVINDIKIDFINAVDESLLIDLDTWRKRPWYQKLIAYILNIFSPLF